MIRKKLYMWCALGHLCVERASTPALALRRAHFRLENLAQL